MVFCQIHHRS